MLPANPRSNAGVAGVALAACLVVAVGHASADGAAHRVDGVAAVVGGTSPGRGVAVILRSDVELSARIALLGGGVAVALGPLPRSLLKATLAELVGEHLIAREARRVQVGSANAAERSSERAQLVGGVGGEARLQSLLAALHAEREEIDAIAERRALVAAFLRANLEGATVVTPAELERAWETEREKFAATEMEDARRALRARLSREALDRAIGRWVSVLRGRIPVQVIAHYDGE